MALVPVHGLSSAGGWQESGLGLQQGGGGEAGCHALGGSSCSRLLVLGISGGPLVYQGRGSGEQHGSSAHVERALDVRLCALVPSRSCSSHTTD